MSVNGVTSTTQTAYSYSTAEAPKANEKNEVTKKEGAADTGVVYEPSKEVKSDSVKKTYMTNHWAEMMGSTSLWQR